MSSNEQKNQKICHICQNSKSKDQLFPVALIDPELKQFIKKIYPDSN